MKNIFRTTLPLFICLAFAGCVKVKENLTGQPTSDKFFHNIEDFQSYISGAYAPIFQDNFTFEGDYAFIAEAGAEDIYHRIGRWRGFEEINVKQVSNPDEIVRPLWNGAYSSISISNTLVGLADTSKIERNLLNPIIGEARFLRALNYFFMVRWFGEVPLLTEKNTIEATTLPQSSVANIYDFIVADLIAAEGFLPATQTSANKPTKGAASALLAKVYLTMAGFPLNQTAKYALAKEQATKVMNMGIYSLNTNFSDLWNWNNRLTNRELIFTLYANSQSGGGSQLHMVSRPGTNSEQGWGDWGTDKRFYAQFPNGPRKDASFYTTMIDGTNFINTNFANPFVAKYRNAGPRSNFFTGPPASDKADGYSPILRYADVLLIYAEAANQAEGSPSTAAYDAIDKVRVRAGLAKLPTGLSKDDFDKAVLAERNWELAFEHNRWFDLCRRQLVKDALGTWYPQASITNNNYLLPKPITALQLMKGLRQNPGY